MHFCVLEDTASINITKIDGTNSAVSFGTSLGRKNVAFCATAPGRGGSGMMDFGGAATGTELWSSSTNNGIVVGTGTTAVAPTDYQLATQVLDGITSGTLEHFTCAATNFTTAGLTASFDIERLFRNSSGGTITLNEVGIYSAMAQFSAQVNFTAIDHFCIIRDIVSPGFAVLNGEYARIVYTISVTS